MLVSQKLLELLGSVFGDIIFELMENVWGREQVDRTSLSHLSLIQKNSSTVFILDFEQYYLKKIAVKIMKFFKGLDQKQDYLGHQAVLQPAEQCELVGHAHSPLCLEKYNNTRYQGICEARLLALCLAHEKHYFSKSNYGSSLNITEVLSLLNLIYKQQLYNPVCQLDHPFSFKRQCLVV